MRPPIRTIKDIEALEREPLEKSITACTVPDILARGAAIDPEKAALISASAHDLAVPAAMLSYRDLMEQVDRAARLFASFGVDTGDAVAILLPVVPQNYVALLGAMTAGIAYPVNWMLGVEQIIQLLSAATVKVLIALGPSSDFDIWEKALQVAEALPKLSQILRVGGGGTDGMGERVADFDSLLAQQVTGAKPSMRRHGPQDIALYIHTGGTTGKPKLAQITHWAIAYKTWAYTHLLDLTSGQVVFGASPLFHVGGIVHHMMSALATGATTVLLGPSGFRNKEAVRNYWRLVERYGITDIFGVPTTLCALAQVPVDGANISSLRSYAMTGSSSLPSQVARHFAERLGVRILCGYGMTENTATVAVPPRDGDPRFGSSGFRLPFTRVRIVKTDASGQVMECKVGEVGEILVRGPGVIDGYVGLGPLDQPFDGDGWLRTGDLGRFDAEQYLWITGRHKDIIIRGGHNIDPSVIEQALLKHEGVEIAAAVGKPDGYAGELPVAYVQLAPDVEISAEDLRTFAREHIAERAAVPVEVTVLQAMPLTGVGKIYKPALRRRAAEAALLSIATHVVASFECAAQVSVVLEETGPARVAIEASEIVEREAINLRLQAALETLSCPFQVEWVDRRPDL